MSMADHRLPDKHARLMAATDAAQAGPPNVEAAVRAVSVALSDGIEANEPDH